MKRSKLLSRLCLFLCLLSSISLQAQVTTQPLTATFTGQPLIDVLTQLKGRGIPIYFIADDIPDKTITGTYQQAPLGELIDDWLTGTEFKVVDYRDDVLVIAPRRILESAFSAQYYTALREQLTDETPEDVGPVILRIGDVSTLSPDGKARVTGIIKEADTGEPIIGATLLWSDLGTGTATDADGRFEMIVPTGEHQLEVAYLGFQPLTTQVQLLGDGQVELEMYRQATDLTTVVVEARAADANVATAQIGKVDVDIKSVRKQPALLGETDIVKGLLLLPGVTNVGEGAVGFNVRGGNVDQNLILLDGGYVFNPSHALGFFSSFNTDLVKSVDLYKANIPAQYGGRLASVLDVELRDGDFERFHIKGGIGPVSSRLAIDGPVIKGTSSFVVGARASYADWVLDLINVPEVQRSSAFFYDANFRYTHKLSDTHRLILSLGGSKDEFTYDERFGFTYESRNGQLIYQGIFSDQFSGRTTVSLGSYESSQLDLAGVSATRVDNDIRYHRLAQQFTLSPQRETTIIFGVSTNIYNVLPGKRSPASDTSLVLPLTLEDDRGLEAAGFASLEWNLTPALSVSGGLRFSYFISSGPATVYKYADPEAPLTTEILDSTRYSKGKQIISYSTPEPRLSLRLRLSPTNSIKLGYSRTAQYLNQIFNSDSPSPTSQYQLSTIYVPPFRGHNFSVGYFQNLDRDKWETSAEVYYRYIDQLYDYRDFANLIVSPNIETELLKGKGRSYGLELSVQRRVGLLNGRLAYTLSRTEQQIQGINNGEYYPSNFDKTHDLSILLNYQPSKRHTLTANFSYNTGRPITGPIGTYRTRENLLVPIYTDRNALRIPDYHRLDLAYTIDQGYNKTKKFKTSWTFSLYNVYGRKNAYSVFYAPSTTAVPKGQKLSILGSVFPAITINFETL